MDETEDEIESGAVEVSEGYETLAHGYLSPRHRRLALLAAQGKSNQEICAELGYVGSRVSVLLKNPYIAKEISALQERIYEETVGGRIKSFAEPALNIIHRALTDQTNKVKMSEKIDVAKWVIEKIDGKATQKIEAGENMLAALMDRLDASKTSRTVNITNNFSPREIEQTTTDVTPTPQISSAPKSEEQCMDDWIIENAEEWK